MNPLAQTRTGRALRRLATWSTFFSILPIVVAILASGYITYRYNSALTALREDVRISLEITTAIDDVLIDLQDLETGQRGYIITGNARYLEPFQVARGRVGDDLSHLRDLLQQRTESAGLVAVLSELTEAKLSELESTIEARRDAGFATAQAIVEGDEGKATMDAIRGVVDRMRAAEADRLRDKTEAIHRQERHVILIVGITIALSILGRLLGLALSVWWSVRKKRTGANA